MARPLLNEFALIERFGKKMRGRLPGVIRGIGDDAAVLKAVAGVPLLWTTDLLIEGVHFRRDWMTPSEIGRKAMRVNLSDIAAMGGRPRWAVVSVGLPTDTKAHRGLPAHRSAVELFEGVATEARRHGVSIVGGDTNAASRLVINIALLGESPFRPLLRSGARVGDRIYVTGTVGGSALGLAALQSGRRTGLGQFIRRHLVPPVRLKVGAEVARRKLGTAMIDLSDGLLGDLGHILESSRVGAEVSVDSLPVPTGLVAAARRLGKDPRLLQLTGGEDYELLFTASPRVRVPPRIGGVPVTPIGRIRPRSRGVVLIDRRGCPVLPPRRLGFEHLA